MIYYDEAFRIEEKKWKTWTSYDKEGNPLVTSNTEEDCISSTRYYLKYRQEQLNSND